MGDSRIVSMKRIIAAALVGSTALLALSGGVGCGDLTLFLNPSFVNTTTGGVVPVTPGPPAAFVLVRARNETGETAEFIITIEREVLRRDDEGNFQLDQDGNFITDPQRETIRLNTAATGGGTDMGVLFPCDESPVTIVGLGEDLLPTDTAVFIGGQGVGGGAGAGVKADDLNPLTLAASNFNCGDTIIFRAFRFTNVAGGVDIQSLLMPGSEQPSEFSGPSTFANLAAFIESQVSEDTP